MVETVNPKPSVTSAGWQKWHAWNERAMSPVTDWVCRAAELSPGIEALDLACGTGLPALSCAARIAPGRLIATDVSPEMVAATRANAALAGLKNVECREMPLEALAFDDASFDVVTCTFGLMFSPNPERAVREIARVLRPGGRFVLAVWDLPQKNPFFGIVFESVARFVPPPKREPGARSMFGLAEDGALATLLGAAGLRATELESRPFEIEFSSIEEHWDCFSDMAPPVKMARQTLPAAELAQLRAALAEALGPTLRDGRPRLTATPILAAGRR